MITGHDVAAKLVDYLQHRIKLTDLVDWAENAMMLEDFSPSEFENIRFIISRIGVADVREFGLSWEDCEDFLSRLGYNVTVKVSEVS